MYVLKWSLYVIGLYVRNWSWGVGIKVEKERDATESGAGARESGARTKEWVEETGLNVKRANISEDPTRLDLLINKLNRLF